jgi:hypothetical protein
VLRLEDRVEMMRPKVGYQPRALSAQRAQTTRAQATRLSASPVSSDWPAEGARVLFQLKGAMAHGTVLKRSDMRVRVTHWVDGALAGMHWVGVEQCADPATDAYTPPARRLSSEATPPPGGRPVAVPGYPPAAPPGGRVPPPMRVAKKGCWDRTKHAMEMERAGSSPPTSATTNGYNGCDYAGVVRRLAAARVAAQEEQERVQVAQRLKLERMSQAAAVLQACIRLRQRWVRFKRRLLEAGTLLVRLDSASGLKAVDFGGTSDPYVVLSIGEQKHTSSTIDRCLEPEWREDFSFRGTLGELRTLRLAVMDHNNLVSDRPLGDATLDVSGLAHGEPRSVALPLSTQGTLNVQIVWQVRRPRGRAQRGGPPMTKACPRLTKLCTLLAGRRGAAAAAAAAPPELGGARLSLAAA